MQAPTGNASDHALICKWGIATEVPVWAHQLPRVQGGTDQTPRISVVPFLVECFSSGFSPRTMRKESMNG